MASKRKAHQEAQRRYRKTKKGMQKHCEAENRRRFRISEKNRETLDDTPANHRYRCLKIQVVPVGLKENKERDIKVKELKEQKKRNDFHAQGFTHDESYLRNCKKQFEKVTGWTGRSNEDTRSAAYFGWLGCR